MGVENSPKRRKRAADFKKRQEKRWAAKNGPVTTRFVDPATLRPSTAGGEGSEGATTSSHASGGDGRSSAPATTTRAPSSSAGDRLEEPPAKRIQSRPASTEIVTNEPR